MKIFRIALIYGMLFLGAGYQVSNAQKLIYPPQGKEVQLEPGFFVTLSSVEMIDSIESFRLILNQREYETDRKLAGNLIVLKPKFKPPYTSEKLSSMELVALNQKKQIVQRSQIDLGLNKIAEVQAQLKSIASPNNDQDKTWEHHGQVYTNQQFDKYDVTPGVDTSEFISDVGANGYGKNKNGLHYNYQTFLTSEDAFDGQSLQRYRVEAGYKDYVELGWGDHYPYYHQFILSNQRVHGLHLHTGGSKSFFQSDLIYGYSKKAYNPQASDQKTLSALLEASSPFDTTQYYRPGIFDRSVLGVQTKLGREERWQWGLSFLKVRDDSSSIHQVKADTGSGAQYLTPPADNLVLGTDLNLKLFKKSTEIFGHGAFSLYTMDNSAGAFNSDDFDEFKDNTTLKSALDYVEKFSALFIYNEHTTYFPFVPQSGSDTTNSFGNTSFNSSGLWNSMAYDVGVKHNLQKDMWKNNAEVKWFRIGSLFRTLGNEYLLTDRQGIEIREDFFWFPTRVQFQVTYRQYEDHISESEQNPGQHRQIGLLAGYFGKGPSIYFNFQDNNSDQVIGDNGDQNTQSRFSSLNGGYLFQTSTWNYQTQLSISNTSFASEYSSGDTTGLSDQSVDNNMWVFNSTLYLIPQQKSWKPRLLYSQNLSDETQNFSYLAPGFGLEWVGFNRKLTADYQSRYKLLNVGGDKIKELDSKVELRYQPFPRHYIQGRIQGVARSGENNLYRMLAAYEFRY